MQKVNRSKQREKKFSRAKVHRLQLKVKDLQEFVSQEYLICAKSSDYTHEHLLCFSLDWYDKDKYPFTFLKIEYTFFSLWTSKHWTTANFPQNTFKKFLINIQLMILLINFYIFMNICKYFKSITLNTFLRLPVTCSYTSSGSTCFHWI